MRAGHRGEVHQLREHDAPAQELQNEKRQLLTVVAEEAVEQPLHSAAAAGAPMRPRQRMTSHTRAAFGT